LLAALIDRYVESAAEKAQWWFVAGATRPKSLAAIVDPFRTEAPFGDQTPPVKG
jgi:hypothetical protein